MTNKVTKYGLMIIAAVLLVVMAFTGAGAAIGGTPVNLTENPTALGSYQVLVVDNLSGAVDKKTAETLAEGKNVYLLEDAADWNAVALDELTYNDTVLILGDNLDFSETDSDNMMVYKFTGKIYGNGYLIENFTNITNTEPNIGLIRNAGTNLYVNYLQQSNCSLKSSDRPIGSLIGCIPDGSNVSIIGCYVFGGDLNSSSSWSVGGLIGYVGSNTLTKLMLNHSHVFNTTIYSYASCSGGLIGGGNYATVNLLNCTVTDCWIYSTKSAVAGLIGSSAANDWEDGKTGLRLTVSNCNVTNCWIESDIRGYVGGLTGSAGQYSSFEYCNVTNCNIIGALDNSGVGGLCGCWQIFQQTVKNCSVINCNITGGNNVGGIVGIHYYGTCTNCSVLNCNIKGNTVNKTGGLAGCGSWQLTTFIDCYAGTSDAKTYISPYGGNQLKGTDSSANVDACSASIADTPISLQFPTKEEIQVFPVSKLPYVYVTYNATDGYVGVPYSPSKKTLAVLYNRSVPENFDGNKITPIYSGYTLKCWISVNTGNVRNPTPAVINNEVVNAIWYIDEYSIVYELDNGTNAVANPSTYTVITPKPIVLEDAVKSGYTFEGWYNESSKSAENKTNVIPAGSTGDKIFYANFTLNVTNVTASGNVVEFGNDNITAIHSTTGAVLSVVLERVKQVNNTAVNFTADNTSVGAIPDINGYTKDEITIFDLNASVNGTTSKFDITVKFADAATADANKNNVRFFHYTASEWEPLTSTIVGINNANVTYSVETTSFSPFGIGIYTAIPQQYTPSSSSKHSGSTVILSEGQVAPTAYATATPTVAPTAKPTEKPATPTVIATTKPTTQATQASPAPFVGLLAGLGAAAVLLRLRK